MQLHIVYILFLFFQPVVGMQVHFFTQEMESECLTVAGVGYKAHRLFVHRAVSALADKVVGEGRMVKVFVPGFGVVQHCLFHGAAARLEVKISSQNIGVLVQIRLQLIQQIMMIEKIVFVAGKIVDENIHTTLFQRQLKGGVADIKNVQI